MKICGVIPARYSSTRFPGKPLVQIKDKMLIRHVYERCLSAQYLNDVFVATDDDRIFAAVQQFGGKAVMTSPDHPSGTDRIAEAVSDIDCDIVINIQGDEPLIDPKVIDQIAETLAADSSIMMATPIVKTTNEAEASNPNIVKVVIDKNGFALYFSRYPVPYIRDTGEKIWYKHIGLYGYRKNFLLQLITYKPTFLEQAERLEQLRVLEHGYRIKTVVTEYQSIGVDTPEDIKEVEKFL